MASTKLVSRLSSRLHHSVFKLNKTSLAHPQVASLKPPSSSTQLPLPGRPVSRSSRLPVQLASMLPLQLASMLPLHSAIASARLISSLSSVSDSWAVVPQGVSMPL